MPSPPTTPDFSPPPSSTGIWALLFGRGLVHPVDLMDSAHPREPPRTPRLARPRLLKPPITTSAASSANVCQIRRLPARLPPRRLHQQDNPPHEAFFARALDKPLSAEALARSLRVALGHEAHRTTKALRNRLRDESSPTFSPRTSPPPFNRRCSSPTAPFFDTDSFSDAPLLSRLLERSKARRISVSAKPSKTCALPRTRRPRELEARALSFVKPKNKSSIQQFVWALLTSAEFRFTN